MIFQHVSYRDYLVEKLEEVFGEARGKWAKLAKAVNCQPSYITHIVKGSAELSLEQAHEINRFLSHTEKEAEYFLLMVQRARAGTDSLKKFLEKQMRSLAQSEKSLSKQLKTDAPSSQEIYQKFFRSWIYGGVYACLPIAKYSSLRAIAGRLGVSETQVLSVLEELKAMGLVQTQNSKYIQIQREFHLPREADFIQSHHLNWRLKAMDKISKGLAKDDLFYSSVISISEKDFNKISQILTKALQDSRSLIRESKDEKLCSFNLDFFEL